MNMDEEVIETIPDKEIIIFGERSQTVQAELTIKNICKDRIAYKMVWATSEKLPYRKRLKIMLEEE
ncbi:conserved hypothetical protein [Trichinella spiralis]|uniref:hypothetical protein n=1 Tax=Trichinella spiralis TaxID=6334 RepID=UPI0001EFF07D|nr:conserved hypothetical protein [Trichinella spiralis]